VGDVFGRNAEAVAGALRAALAEVVDLDPGLLFDARYLRGQDRREHVAGVQNLILGLAMRRAAHLL